MGLEDRDLSAQIRQQATRYRASDQLRANVRTQVTLAEAGRSAAPPPVRKWWRAFSWQPALAGFACGVVAALVVAPMWRMRADRTLEAELVSDHVHALRVGPLTEIVSTDRHTVKPWFQGRLDYAPPVHDLDADGFPLLGGRVEHVRGNTVAALAYTHNKHVINLFVWPTDHTEAVQRQERKGFNVVHWADGSMQYWVVSDVDRIEIERFAQSWKSRSSAIR